MRSRVLVVAALALCASLPALACGGENQRPCTVLERVPSCNSGLVEDFGKGLCIRPAPAAPSCGKANGRPCLVTERIPSCDGGLVEDFARNLCVAPAERKCGAQDQRPCMVLERVPSCDAGLAEDFARNRCVPEQSLIATSCREAIAFVRTQAREAGPELDKDTDQLAAYFASHPESKKAVEEAKRQLMSRYSAEIAQVKAAAIEYAGPTHRVAKGSADEALCDQAAKSTMELRDILARHTGNMLSRGAFTLAATVEADAIVGVQLTAGPVFAYDMHGTEQIGLQVSAQGQIISDIDVASGGQIGWWPGSKISERNTWEAAVGAGHDGLLSGPYMSVHGGIGPEALAEVEIAIDLVFELPDLSRDVSLQWLLDHFAGVTVTVSGGLSALPLQGSVGAAVGNTFTATLVNAPMFEAAKPAPAPAPAPARSTPPSGGRTMGRPR